MQRKPSIIQLVMAMLLSFGLAASGDAAVRPGPGDGSAKDGPVELEGAERSPDVPDDVARATAAKAPRPTAKA